MIGVCRDFGVPAGRVEGRSGAWVAGDGHGRPDREAGRDRRSGWPAGVTMHGFALNCDCDLSWYDRIVPCGIPDASVTSLSAETGSRISVLDALASAERHLAAAFGAIERALPGRPA